MKLLRFRTGEIVYNSLTSSKADEAAVCCRSKGGGWGINSCTCDSVGYRKNKILDLGKKKKKDRSFQIQLLVTIFHLEENTFSTGQ
jgi:hypothetical protein